MAATIYSLRDKRHILKLMFLTLTVDELRHNIKLFFSDLLKLTSHGILHYLWSADLSKSFSQNV